MDNKTKIAALLLAGTIGGVTARLAAAPDRPTVRLIAMTVEPVVVLTVVVRGKPVQLQCTDVSGAAVRLAGRPFSPADQLCAAAAKFAADGKASVGLLADAIDQQLSETK